MTFGSQNSRTTALAWSPDGTILTIAVASGSIYNFVDKPRTMLHASYGSRLAYLSNLCEVSNVVLFLFPAIVSHHIFVLKHMLMCVWPQVNVVDGAAHTNSSMPPRSITIPILIEPTFVALGANHVAVGTNIHVLYYRVQVRRRMEHGSLTSSTTTFYLI